MNYFRMATLGLLPKEECHPRARDAVNRALEIDPNYAPAYAHFAWLSIFHDNDLTAAACSMR